MAWGPGRYAPEASAGIPLLILNSLNFRRRRQEASAPAPSTEKSVPHGSQRTGLAARPWAPWTFTANLFSSDLGHPPVTEGLPGLSFDSILSRRGGNPGRWLKVFGRGEIFCQVAVKKLRHSGPTVARFIRGNQFDRLSGGKPRKEYRHGSVSINCL